jgi:hypothetical protein
MVFSFRSAAGEGGGFEVGGFAEPGLALGLGDAGLRRL